MSTRSIIAIEYPDGSCKASYCHHDGYPSHNGRLLVDHHNTPEAVEALLTLGALSCLGVRLAPSSGEKHSYDCPGRDICIAYHRDRGEEFQPSELWPDANELLSNAADSYWAEYVYIFRNGEWHVDSPYEPCGWRTVVDVLQEGRV